MPQACQSRIQDLLLGVILGHFMTPKLPLRCQSPDLQALKSASNQIGAGGRGEALGIRRTPEGGAGRVGITWSSCETESTLGNYLPICLSVCLSACLSVSLPVCLLVCLSVYQSACLSACLSYLFVPLSVYLSVCLSESRIQNIQMTRQGFT